MIDKQKHIIEVREAAQLYLSNINQMSGSEIRDNLEYFGEKCKMIAEGILEQYVFENVSKYTEGDFSIQDVKTLGAFVDFHIGYQAQMLQWIEAHPFEVKEKIFEFTTKLTRKYNKEYVTPKYIFIVGTILAVSIFIFTNIWFSLIAEFLTVLLYKAQNVRIQKSAVQRKMQKEYYKTALDKKEYEFVNVTLVELEKWLDQGVEKSKEILSTYNLL